MSPALQVPWALAAAVATLAAAAWLRQPAVPALVGCALATIAAGAITRPRADRGRWRAGFVASLALFCALAVVSQRAIQRVESDWDAYAAGLRGRALSAMRAQLTVVAEELRAASVRALRAPADPALAARELASLAAGRVGERGVVLYRGGAAAAWGGRLRISLDTLQRPFGAGVNAFYLVLYAVSAQHGDVAVAAATVHAEPPAGRLAPALDHIVTEQTGVGGFEFGPPQPAAGDSVFTFAPGGGQALFSVRARPLVPGETLLRVTEQARVRGAAALALALVCFTVALWRRRADLRVRLLALLVALAVLGVVPLNALSNISQLFDPSFYFAPLGGPFTASVGALGLSSGILLLALLAVLRSPIRFPSRWVALLVVLAIAGTGPFLLRELSRGISPPTWGVSVRLWLAWEVTLFLAAVSLLLAGASAGRAALGGRRGLAPTAAPLLAGFAALLAPLILDASGRWPAWYSGLWIAAIGALALTRRARGIVLAAAAVAAFGATTLVWGATARQRVQLAERDIEGLGSADPYARSLLERFESDLSRDAPSSRAELLQRYVTSDLAAAGYLPRLTSWAPGAAAPTAELLMSPIAGRPPSLAEVVAEARERRAPVMRAAPSLYGVQLLLAVPDDSGAVTAVVVPPRSRLAPDDPFSTLLGLAPEVATEPPYTLSLVEADPAVAAASESASGPRVRWQREGNELHG
ncbi:MAG TPA: hypothetical protein VKA84_25280, partial [Gemmatimonadaceae bacterium]|nr:hypothetical protein [Gemmatimonadaceae bacterium]